MCRITKNIFGFLWILVFCSNVRADQDYSALKKLGWTQDGNECFQMWITWLSFFFIKDLPDIVAAMLKASDRLEAFDPFHILRDPDSILKGRSSDWKPLNNFSKDHSVREMKIWKVSRILLDLTLPESFEEWQMEEVHRLIEQDHLGILDKAIEAMDEFNEVDPKSKPNFVLKYLIAPLTPVLNVDEPCFRQSMAYFFSLLSMNGDQLRSLWPLFSE